MDRIVDLILDAIGLAIVAVAALTVRAFFQMRRDDRRRHDDQTRHRPV